MRSTLIRRVLSGCLLALLTPLLVQAKQSDFKEKVYIDAGQQFAELQQNRITFTDAVVITQGTIKINADKVVVTRDPNKQKSEVMTAYGKPATMFQILDNGKPVYAHGETIHYDMQTNLITLTGNAHLKQEDSQIDADVINYDVTKEQMRANSTQKSSRVKSVFLPEQLQNFNNPAATEQPKSEE